MTDIEASDDDARIPFSRGARWWRNHRRRRRRLALFVTVVVAISALGFGARWALPQFQCGFGFSEVREVAGECVGVTDGSFVFQEAFAEVQENIRAENEWAADKAEAEDLPLVRIALLTTLTTTDDSAMSTDKIQSALEGAYVALHRANRTRELGDPQPYVQLYLANEGARQTHWELAVSQLEEMLDDEVPLVAVMGQGVSSDATVAAAERLAARGIPMVTGVTTADGIDHDGIDGLLRAAPSNTDFAVACAAVWTRAVTWNRRSWSTTALLRTATPRPCARPTSPSSAPT